MKNYILSILFILPFLFTTSTSIAQAPKTGVVKISGEVTNPFDLTAEGLHQFSQTDVTRKDHDGKNHIYTGVLLSTILKKAGVTLGKDLRGKNLAKYILVDAADGYQVTFALAELDGDFTGRQIIIADKVEGKPLDPTEGPFRIIVQDEKKPARCIRQVTAIKVAFAK